MINIAGGKNNSVLLIDNEFPINQLQMLTILSKSLKIPSGAFVITLSQISFNCKSCKSLTDALSWFKKLTIIGIKLTVTLIYILLELGLWNLKYREFSDAIWLRNRIKLILITLNSN